MVPGREAARRARRLPPRRHGDVRAHVRLRRGAVPALAGGQEVPRGRLRVRLREPLPARRGISFALPRSPFSLRSLRWFEVDWHILAIAGGLLLLGVAFVHAM